MNRIPILAGGAVLAAVVLCGGAVTVANALTATPSSQVLAIAGVSTTPTATASASPSDDPTATASPSPSASATSEPGDDNGGVVVVKPSDPTKIDGKGCAHLGKHGGADDPADHDATDDHKQGTSTPTDPSGGTGSGSGHSGSGSWGGGSGSWGGSGGDDGSHHGGFGGRGGDGGGHH